MSLITLAIVLAGLGVFLWGLSHLIEVFPPTAMSIGHDIINEIGKQAMFVVSHPDPEEAHIFVWSSGAGEQLHALVMDSAEVRELQTELARRAKDVNDLNNLLRAAGWGQGEIDSAAAIEEENEKLRTENSTLRAAIAAAKNPP